MIDCHIKERKNMEQTDTPKQNEENFEQYNFALWETYDGDLVRLISPIGEKDQKFSFFRISEKTKNSGVEIKVGDTCTSDFVHRPVNEAAKQYDEETIIKDSYMTEDDDESDDVEPPV
jgi:hypothetical protein